MLARQGAHGGCQHSGAGEEEATLSVQAADISTTVYSGRKATTHKKERQNQHPGTRVGEEGSLVRAGTEGHPFGIDRPMGRRL